MIILKTTYPCLVKTASDICEIDETDTLEIEDENFLFVYPQNTKKIPFYINLDSLIENENFSIFIRENKTFIILESPQALNFSQKESLFFGQNKCTVGIEGNVLSFESESKKVSYACSHSCNNLKVSKINNFACAEFDEDIYLFNTKTSKLSHISGNIKKDNNHITACRIFADSVKREKIATYSIGEEIVLEEEVFTENAPKIKELAPYQLMESVKAKDWNHAISFLSENLQNKIDASKMKEFFGDITSVLPLSITEFITLSGKQKNFVSFKLEDNKIDDITCDSL